jgi:hypothetical protein
VVYMPPNIPARLQSKVSRLLSDRDAFCQLLKVKNKQTQDFVPFIPNAAQKRLWELMDRSNRVIVVKARQVGISTAVRAWQVHAAYTSNQPKTFAVLSFHDRSAKTLRRMDRRWLTELPAMLQRETSIDSADDTVFADTKAGFSSFTTGGRGGTRSFEFSGAHLSEFAFYVDADEVLAQSVSTVGDGPLVIESTVNVPGDAFHRLIAGSPENGWTVFTYWWWEHPPYRDDSHPPGLKLTTEELRLQGQYGLDLAQLYWRRQQIATLGIQKFRREYPACIEDCFVNREGGYFEEELMQKITPIPFDAVGESAPREIESPRAHDRYVMGVDTGGGVGGDFSAMCVVSVGTGQPVYTERTARLSPGAWAHRVIQVASRYNKAMILAESNNHGHAVLLELQNCMYQNLWCHPETKKHWVTTLQSKLDMYAVLRQALQTIQVMDQTTYMELRSLTIPQGKMAPEAPSGGHDDCAVAMALAYRALSDVPAPWRTVALQSGKDRIQSLLAASRARRIRSKNLPF